MFVDNLTAVEVLLDGEEYLVGIDGFYEVVGNAVADGLVHDVFFFGLCDHDYGDFGVPLVDDVEGFEA